MTRYWGAVEDRGLTYFVPDNADSIGVLHAASQSFVAIEPWCGSGFRCSVCVIVSFFQRFID